MPFIALSRPVFNRGIPPDSFLDELIEWGESAPDDVFVPLQPQNIFTSVVSSLGPWQGPLHMRAAMLEVLRVLAGFESSWNWNEGRDTTAVNDVDNPVTWEAGAWQVSADSMDIVPELKSLILSRASGAIDPLTFQEVMKSDHALAMEYITRLLCNNVDQNGPVKSHAIDQFLSRDAVNEFSSLLSGV